MGFGAHGPDFHYYLDGGELIKGESLPSVIDNISLALNDILHQQPDFILLQEVDVRATRSHYTAQIDMISRVMSNYATIKINIVPFKWFNTGKDRNSVFKITCC